MRVTIRRGNAEAIFEDAGAAPLAELQKIVRVLTDSFNTPADGLHVDTGGRVERAEQFEEPGESPRRVIGFQP